jgi:hypothetical protein
MRDAAKRPVPYRRSIYWKIEQSKTGREILVYSLGGLIRLNGTASLIWELLDGWHGVEEMLVALRERFPDAPGERLKEDVESFLRSAEVSGLILRHWSPLQPYEVASEELVP